MKKISLLVAACLLFAATAEAQVPGDIWVNERTGHSVVLSTSNTTVSTAAATSAAYLAIGTAIVYNTSPTAGYVDCVLRAAGGADQVGYMYSVPIFPNQIVTITGQYFRTPGQGSASAYMTCRALGSGYTLTLVDARISLIFGRVSVR